MDEKTINVIVETSKKLQAAEVPENDRYIVIDGVVFSLDTGKPVDDKYPSTTVCPQCGYSKANILDVYIFKKCFHCAWVEAGERVGLF